MSDNPKIYADAKSQQALFATAPHGLEQLLYEELQTLGATDLKIAGAGVRFHANLQSSYRICLCSRLANRILLPVHRGAADSPETLYTLISAMDWSEYMTLQTTFAIDFFSANSNITHTQYGALKVKDAIVDQFRERSGGERPSVQRTDPDLRINVYVFRDQARIAIDWSGRSLHQRGYRIEDAPAPLKENLAAAMLLSSKWPERAAAGKPFLDPMCGSGTLLTEAAMIAADVAPGLLRERFGFHGWTGHQEDLFQQVRTEVEQQAETGKQQLREQIKKNGHLIHGSDIHTKAIRSSEGNLQSAGLDDFVSLSKQDFMRQRKSTPAALNSTTSHDKQLADGGLLLFNPPYGERLDSGMPEVEFYKSSARVLKQQYQGWSVGVLAPQKSPHYLLRLEHGTKNEHPTASDDSNDELRKNKYKKHNPKYRKKAGNNQKGESGREALQFVNGGIPCRLVSGDIPVPYHLLNPSMSVANTGNVNTANTEEKTTSPWNNKSGNKNNIKNSTQNDKTNEKNEIGDTAVTTSVATDRNSNSADSFLTGNTDFINRLKKNRKKLSAWVKREDISAYRLYDADIPEFAVAVDIYRGTAAQSTTTEPGTSATHVVIQEYRAPATIDPDKAHARLMHAVEACQTLLELPAAQVHLKVRERQKGSSQYRRQQSTNENLIIDEFGCQVIVNPGDYLDTGLFLDHRKVRQFIQQESAGKSFLNLFCYTATATAQAITGGAARSVSVDSSRRYLDWAANNLQLLEKPLENHTLTRGDVMTWLSDAEDSYDLILLDPPTFSNSSEFDHDWDIQKHHLDCIKHCLNRLSNDGLLIFSTNFKRFKLDQQLHSMADIEERSDWSMGPDFARNRRIHRCWFITKSATRAAGG